MLTRFRKRASGFTLVELMIVVAIIGILAAVAISAFSKYVKKSRTAEAVGYLNKMWAGSVSYYETDHMEAGRTAALPKQFPGPIGRPEQGATECCVMTGAKCPSWDAAQAADPVWSALSFSLPDSHAYKPLYSAVGTNTDSAFTAQAQGDLDCDTVMAIFTRLGKIGNSGDVAVSMAPAVTNELE